MTDRRTTQETAHLATARKWRPRVFGDIVGQEHITTTLRNAVAAGRVGHAYLFSGPRGVGKTTTARILARAVNCLHPQGSEPDNSCELCLEIIEGRSLNVFEIDGASNRGVDEIRNLREAVRYGPGKGRSKVYIIDEVHMLTKEAFNALLKTLEEPPSWIVFMFATTEVHRVPPTILSRCQRFEFRRISQADIAASIAAIARTEKIDIDEATLDLIARRADGSLRDSQGIFDQVVSMCGQTVRAAEVRAMLKVIDDDVYFRVTDAVSARDGGAGFAIVDEAARSGFDLREFAGGLAGHFRNLLVVRSTGTADLVDGSDRLRQRYAAAASAFAEADLLRLMKIASDTEAAMRWSAQPRLKLELALQLMIALESTADLSSLLTGIEELKKKQHGRTAPGPDAPRERTDRAQAPAPPPGDPHGLRPAPPAPSRADAHGASDKGRDSSLPPDRPGRAGAPAPLRGTVKASQPSLRPDQLVGGGVPPVVATMLPGSVAEAVPAAFDGAEGSRNWQKLVEQVSREKIAVGSMLSSTSFHAAAGSRVRIACPDDFHAGVLKRNSQYISALAERIYGARWQFESILASMPAADDPAAGAPAQASSASGPSGGAPPAPGAKERDPRDHPLVRAVVREFGAEEIH